MINVNRVSAVALALLLGAVWPLPAAAQDSQGVGVVTTLSGSATVARPTVPQPLPLKFKDDVFEKDRISTAEKSLVRVLLGGKAIVTVRELSVLTITEDMGRAEINLQSGKIALAVAKQRMKPGESITIRARNAVAAIRGTVVIAEIRTATAQAGQPAQFGGIGTFHVRNGTVEVSPPGGNPFSVGPMQSGDGTGRVWTRTPEEDAALDEGLTTDDRGGLPDGLWEQEQDQATFLGNLIIPDRGNTPPPVIDPCAKDPNAEGCKQNPSNQNPTNNVTFQTPPLSNFDKLLKNPGAEDVLSSWNTTGAGFSAPNFGFLNPPADSKMFLIHTGNGAVNNFTSTLSQGFSFTGGRVFALGFNSAMVSNEFPSQPTTFNDTFQVTAIDSAGNQALLAMESRNTAAFAYATQQFNSNGFSTNTNPYGVTDFRSWARTWVTTTTDSGTLQFKIFDVGDNIFDSAALIDSVFAYALTPALLVRNGAQLITTGPGALAEWINQPPVAFDSLMVICCQGSANLGGRLLHAKNTNLSVPVSILSVVQGGMFKTTSTDSVAFLEGGTHSIGTQVAAFDLSGVNTAPDLTVGYPGVGLSLGTDKIMQFPGALFETSGATVNTRKVMQIDTALVEASLPLIWAHNGSNITTSLDAVDLAFRARVTSLSPVVRLDASTLTVANGSAINVAASVLRITGDLFSLINGSTLRVLNGTLLNASGGSSVFVSGAFIGFGGVGGNLISVANSFCPCTLVGGIPVALVGGATAAQVSIGAGAIRNPTLGSITPNVALIRVFGPATRVTIGGTGGS